MSNDKKIDEEKVERFERSKKPSKIDVIKASKMPDWQKKQMIDQLEKKDESLEGKVPFGIYAKIKKLGSGAQKAMLAYPEAKKVSLATLKEWDEIFKNF